MEFARLFDGKKFMWDGKIYGDQSECQGQEQHYHSLGFEVRSLVEADGYYLFTRRVVANTQG
jgi:hypothetical protein